ncbi:MAG: BON domain-containing protein [Gammaproteobacteria bacterium]
MQETDKSAGILDEARAALGMEPRLDVHATPVSLALEQGVLTAEGELEDVAVKKLALERLAAVPGVTGIIDRLRVAPAERMGDDQIRVLVRDALVQDPALGNIALYEIDKGERLPLHVPSEGGRGVITVSVADGIVTLDGDVPGLAQKRLAGVLAWWVPGSRDVVNGIGVKPPEEDSDEEITEAVRVVLEKDPFVNAGQIRVRTEKAEVILDGYVPTESERHMAECDAWYVFGVDRVSNRIRVHH